MTLPIVVYGIFFTYCLMSLFYQFYQFYSSPLLMRDFSDVGSGRFSLLLCFLMSWVFYQWVWGWTLIVFVVVFHYLIDFWFHMIVVVDVFDDAVFNDWFRDHIWVKFVSFIFYVRFVFFIFDVGIYCVWFDFLIWLLLTFYMMIVYFSCIYFVDYFLLLFSVYFLIFLLILYWYFLCVNYI